MTLQQTIKKLIFVVLAMALLLLAGCTEIAPDSADSQVEMSHPAPHENRWWGDVVVPTQSVEVSAGAEPSILESKDGSFLWIGDTSGLYISEDDGATWIEGASPFLLSADGWDLAEDDNEVLYFTTTTTASLTIASSSDGGYTTDYSSNVIDVAPVADRPWIAARGDGELAIFMYDFGRTTSETCIRSTDGGETWPDRGFFSQAPQGGGALFDDDGNAYVGLDEGVIVSYGSSCLMSTNDLETTEYEMFSHDVNSHMLNPSLENGVLYMAAQSADQWHGLFVSALDISSGERVLHEIVAPATKTVMFPRTDVQDGRLVVSWYGSEDPGDPTVVGFGGSFNVYVAVVDGLAEGSPTSQVVRVTDIPNHVGDICVGGVGCGAENDRNLLDYFGLDIGLGGRIHIAFGDDREGSQRRVSYAQVSLADIPAVAPAPTPPQSSSNESPTPSGEPPVEPHEDLEPVIEVHFTLENGTVYGDASESYDPDGGELVVEWVWGDGTSDVGLIQSHKYEVGTYSLNVVLRDNEGNRGLRSATIDIPEYESGVVGASAPPQNRESPFPLWSFFALLFLRRK